MKKEWKQAKLGEIADVQSGGTPSISNTKYWDGDVPWYSSGELNTAVTTHPERTISLAGIGGSNAKLFPAGSLLIGMYDTAAMKMSILDRDAAFNQAIAGVKPNAAISMRFVFYALNSIKDELLGQRRGVRQKNLSLGKVRDFPIPQLPLDEQERIVAILDEAFEGIATAKANAEKNLRNVRDLLGRISGEVLTQLAPISRTAKLEDVVEPDCSLSYGIVQPGDERPDGLPIVRPVDLNCSAVGLDGLKRIDPALAKSYDRTTLKGNDILLCVRGTTGTLALADSELAGANVTRGIVPIRFDSAQLSQDFGYCLMRSEPVQMQIRAKTYGTALMQINIRDLRQLSLPIPPLHEQAAVVQRLGDVEVAADQLIAIYERKLAALDELKKSLLHQAFSGALTARKADPQLQAQA